MVFLFAEDPAHYQRLHLGMLRAYLQTWLLALFTGQASRDETAQHIEPDEFVRVIAASGLLAEPAHRKLFQAAGLLSGASLPETFLPVTA